MLTVSLQNANIFNEKMCIRDRVTAAHALSGAERAFSKQFQGVSRTEIVAHTLRMFGQGTKVCAEISLMSADCGAVEYGRQLIAIGGTGRGARCV